MALDISKSVEIIEIHGKCGLPNQTNTIGTEIFSVQRTSPWSRERYVLNETAV